MLLEPRETDGPTVRDEEQIPTILSEDTLIARSLNTGWSAIIPTSLGSWDQNAMSPPFYTYAYRDPVPRSLSAMWDATAPATPAMGPTPATTDASHILRTTSWSPDEGGYGS